MLNYYKYDVHFRIRQVVSCIHIKASVPICARGDPSWDCVGRMRMFLIRACVLLGMRVVRVQRVRWSRKVYTAMGIDVNQVIHRVYRITALFQNVSRLSDLPRRKRYLPFFFVIIVSRLAGSVYDTHRLEIWRESNLSKYYNSWKFKLIIIQFLYI